MKLLMSISAMFVFLFAVNALAQGQGVLMVVKGDIQVVSGKNKEAVKAKVGQQVLEGDTIIAGKDSRAKLVMMDKNIINISPDSKFLLEKYVNDEKKEDKNVVLNVLYGKVRSTVNQKYDGEKNKFHVKTPSAVAGVRGTDFLSSYSPQSKQASFVTFSGAVEVGQLGTNGRIMNAVTVMPGQQTVASMGQPPAPPTEVPKNTMNAMVAETKSEEAADAKGDSRQPAAEEQKKEDKKEDKKDEKEMKKENKDAAKEDKKEDKKEAKKEDATAKKEAAPAKKEDAPAKKDAAAAPAPAPASETAAAPAPGAPAPDAGAQPPMPAAGPVLGISADDLGAGKDMPSFDMTRSPASTGDSAGGAGDIYLPPVIPNVGPVLPPVIDPGMFNRDKSTLQINIR